MTTQEIVKTAVKIMEDKKGSEIKVIDISKVSVIADYFILVSGSNRNQTQAIADEIHIFNSEDRRFYNLERIWTDGTIVDGPERL